MINFDKEISVTREERYPLAEIRIKNGFKSSNFKVYDLFMQKKKNVFVNIIHIISEFLIYVLIK